MFSVYANAIVTVAAADAEIQLRRSVKLAYCTFLPMRMHYILLELFHTEAKTWIWNRKMSAIVIPL